MGNMTKEEKQAMATRIASEVVLLLKIKSVLESHPKGLKAREIADLIPKTDKAAINHILYSYKSEFEVKDYVWKLKKQDKPAIPKAPAKESPVTKLLKKHYGNSPGISKTIKTKISSLGEAAFNTFAENLDKLNSNKKIPKPTNNESGDIDFCLELAFLGSDEFAEIERRSKKIYTHRADIIYNFFCWRQLMKISATDFDAIMLYAGKLKKLQLIPNLSCLDWLELITLLYAKKNFSEFSKNNEFINNTFSAKDFGSTPYPKWKELVLLQGEAFSASVSKLKSAKWERENSARSWEREEQRRKENAYRDKMAAEARRNPAAPVLEITRACTGNCSTCNRTECVEDRSKK